MKNLSVAVFGAMLLLMAPIAKSQSTPAVPVNANTIFELCKSALTKKYADEKIADPEAANYAAQHTCAYFAQKCKAEPDGETCKKAIRDFPGK